MKRPGVARRGDELRVHILFAAKEVFLEMGFERASMDTIAERAQTSKRTLYAHFENKEKLYLAVIELVRQSFLERLKSPSDYSEDTEEALVQFAARFVRILHFAPVIRMCRMSIAEVDRFPEGSALYYRTIIDDVSDVVSAYLKKQLRLTPKASAAAAQTLLGRLVFPTFIRALFGLESLRTEIIDELPAEDLKTARKIVAEFLQSLG